MRSLAVVGSGISGLSVAHALAGERRVTLFEAGAWFGGHTHTVDLELDGIVHGVDTGFLVFNERTYPNLIRLFGELGIAVAASEMSFSVQAREDRIEWSGTNLNALFAQRGNLLRPRFWAMLADLRRFNRIANALAEQRAEDGDGGLQEPIGDFLRRHAFSDTFRHWYLLPMLGCIWSCPTDQMLRFPLAALVRFCHNHGLLQLTNRPRWFTVPGGARQYVNQMLRPVTDARLNTPVRSVRRLPAASGEAGVVVQTDAGSERFDDVVLACHSDQSLALLADASPAERELLGAVRYQPNRAVLHTDTRLLPARKRAWAAWNYERADGQARGAAESAAVCLHYLLNRLQPLPWTRPVIVSLNPARAPREDCVHAEFNYAHPVFDQAAIDAQARLPELQGRAHTWFCGAWTGYGFHEDGLKSGLALVQALREHASQAEARNAA